MFILVLLAGGVTVGVVKWVEQAKVTRAKTDVEKLGMAINSFRMQNGSYPPNLEALRTKPAGEDLPKWDGPYVDKPVPNDPWDKPYFYVNPGEHNTDSFDLYSYGRDGKEGGEKSDADITNWE
jgi:general secretion pathway protein G